MLQGEHSAILSTFVKLPFVINIFVLSIFEWPFYMCINAQVRGHLEENVYYIDIPTGDLIDDVWQGRRCTADHPACSDPRETQTLVVCLQKGKYSGSPASKILLLPITGTFTLIQFSWSHRDLEYGYLI